MKMDPSPHGSQPQTLENALEALEPHDHLCVIYETEDEWRDVMVPFIAIGLRRAEKCIYVADTGTFGELRAHLKDAGVDVAAAEARGQLVILHDMETYTQEGTFDPDRMIARLISETDKALQEGYSALRVTGEMSWVLKAHPGSERLLEYEAKLNRDLLPGHPCLAICQYNRWKFDAEILKGVILTHPLLIRENQILRNFYYIPPGEYLGDRRADHEVQHWLNNIKREHDTGALLFQSQKMEVIGRATASIAHNFNNMLTAVNGFAELLQLHMAPDDPLQEYVQRIRAAGQSAADLVRHMMAFSRRHVMVPAAVNLNVTLLDMRRMLESMIGEDVRIEAHLASDLWPVQIDPTQLQQIIVNLAINARDAMPGGGRLTLETANKVLDECYTLTHPDSQPGEYVMLAASDTGCGMSDEVCQHLFEPFFTTKSAGKGTGLGLYTVYNIVEQSGGHIEVTSQVGMGTTFRILLARAGRDGNPSATVERTADRMSGSETILLVEDSPEVREVVRTVLVAGGYRVIEATCAEEARRLAQEWAGPIHLLLTDIVMPDLRGDELAAQLTRQHPGLAVLFMSGRDRQEIEHNGRLQPNVAFLQKPFDAFGLARMVRQVCDKRITQRRSGGAPSRGQPVAEGHTATGVQV
jgi:signal transduction histidine kinase